MLVPTQGESLLRFAAQLLGEVARLGLAVLRDRDAQEIRKDVLLDNDLARRDLDGLREVLRNLVPMTISLVGSDRERNLVGALLVEPEGQVVVGSVCGVLLVFGDHCAVEVRPLGEVFTWTAAATCEKRNPENEPREQR